MTSLLESCFVFSAIPGENDLPDLFCSYQKKFLSSLEIYFSKFAESSKIDLSFPINRLKSLEPKRRFSSELYTIYVRLKEAYEKKDVEAVLDTIQDFTNLKVDDFYAEEMQYNSLLSERWEKPFVKELRESAPRDDDGNFLKGHPHKIYPLVNWDKEAFPPSQLKESDEIFKKIDPALYQEFQTYVSRVKLFSSKSLASTTSPRFFGSIYLRLPFSSEDPLLFYLEQIVHEVSHLHLFVLMGEDPIILNQNELHESPLREDKRPMIGVFHATFVLARIVRILKKYSQAVAFLSPETILTQEKLFFKGLETVTSFGNLTENGQKLLNTFEACAFDW